MSQFIGIAGFAFAGLAFLFLLLLLCTVERTSLPKKMLMLASFTSLLWSVTLAMQLYFQQFIFELTVLETVRSGSFFLLLISAMSPESSWRELWRGSPLAKMVSLSVVAMASTELALMGMGLADLSVILSIHLAQSVVLLWLLERLYRMTLDNSRWALKPLCMGLGLIGVFDFAFYADSLILHSISGDYWLMRGWVALLAAPLLLLTTRRMRQWSAKIYVSREVVYTSTLLMAAGGYLLVMALSGYYIRYAGGQWGIAIQTVFLALSGLLLVSVFLSGTVRRRLKVLIAKHFFVNKYEYREEWTRLAALMNNGRQTPYSTALQAMMTPFDCEKGVLAIAGSSSQMRSFSRQTGAFDTKGALDLGHPLQTKTNERRNPGIKNRFTVCALQGADRSHPEIKPLLDNLAWPAVEADWVLDLASTGSGKDTRAFAPFDIPAGLLSQAKDFVIVVPVIAEGGANAVFLLSKPRSTTNMNWEDRDLMKAISVQLSVFLNLHISTEALAEGRQFETFNRMSAFLVHDLKNVEAQLKLLSRNSLKHRDNPEFITDAFDTVDSAATRLTKVLAQLRQRRVEEANTEPVFLNALLEGVCRQLGGSHPKPEWTQAAQNLSITANRERLENVFVHLVQNAQQATGSGGSVRVVCTEKEGHRCCIDICDDGIGMDEEFIEKRLFAPFDTTKGNAGMGIGAYEAKKLVEELGGTLNVTSSPGKGSCFSVELPVQQHVSRSQVS